MLTEQDARSGRFYGHKSVHVLGTSAQSWVGKAVEGSYRRSHLEFVFQWTLMEKPEVPTELVEIKSITIVARKSIFPPDFLRLSSNDYTLSPKLLIQKRCLSTKCSQWLRKGCASFANCVNVNLQANLYILICTLHSNGWILIADMVELCNHNSTMSVTKIELLEYGCI